MAKAKIEFEEEEDREEKEEKFSKKAGKALEKAIDATEDVAKKTIKEIEEQTEKIYEEIKELKAKAAPKVKQLEKKIAKEVKQAGKNVVKEVKKVENKMAKSKESKETKVEGVSGLIQFKDWEKIDLRVAKIKKVEDIEGADKLYKLTLDVGELGTKIVCAGIKEHYEKDELKGKKLIFFANLAPRMMKGINSQGMILAAVSKNHSEVVLIEPDKDIDAGARVS